MLRVAAFLLIGVLAFAQAQHRDFQFSAPEKELLDTANALDEQFEKKGLLYRDPGLEAFLDSFVSKLTSSSSLPDHVIVRIRVLRDPTVNAFSFPNGSLYLDSGMIAALENEAQLAGVLAHELGHVINRDAYILNRSSRSKTAGMNAVGVAAVASSVVYPGVGLGAAGVLGSASSKNEVLATVVQRGYPDSTELGADRFAAELLRRLGYDTAELMKAVQRLNENLEYESTTNPWRVHAILQRRAASLDQANSYRDSASIPSAPDNYLEQVFPVIRSNVLADIEVHRARTAVARAKRLLAWRNNAQNGTLLADAYHALGAFTAEPVVDEARERKQFEKLTEEEVQRKLASTREGKETLSANRTEAESLYLKAIAMDSALPDPHRELGMLYEDELKAADAVREYRDYLRLAPSSAIDRLRIERRLEDVLALSEEGRQ